jgi:G6PDH family F420-dependent oxidoreductase
VPLLAVVTGVTVRWRDRPLDARRRVERWADWDPEPATAICGRLDGSENSLASIDLAVELGDAFISTEPDADMVAEYRQKAGHCARMIGQMPLSYDADAGRATEYARRFAFGVAGWKVMSELPNVVNFDAAASTVRDEDIAEVAGIGPDPDDHVEAIMGFVEAGYDEVCVVQVGDDKEGFFRFWADKLAPRVETAAR